jgi:hypothetical protein
MTEDELLQVFHAVKVLDPASAQACAEAALLDFLCTEGYAHVVEAYMQLREGSIASVERQ